MRLVSMIATLSLLAVLGAAQATDVDAFEILGLKLGDDLATVKATLAKQGFDLDRPEVERHDPGPYLYFTVSRWDPEHRPMGQTVMVEVGRFTGLYKLNYVQEPVAYAEVPEAIDALCKQFGAEQAACERSGSGLMVWRDDEDLSKSLKVRVSGVIDMRLEDRDAYYENIRQYRQWGAMVPYGMPER